MATFLSLKLVWLVLQLIVDTLGINSVNKEMLRISSSGDVSSTLENENTDVPSFLEFITQFQRSYTPYSEEYETREAYFKKHVEVVREHNSKSGHKWRAAVNALADRKPEELAFLRGWSRNVRPHGAAQAGVVTSELTGTRQNITDAPSCVDWTHLDSVQAVLNQGACGSCWAFAAVKAIEAGSEIFQATRRTCSAEQIVSCTRNPRSCGGTGGCSGATSELAFEYVLGTGCQTESDIPYLGVEAVCKTPAYHDKGPYSKAQLLSDGIEMHSLTEGHASSFGMVGWQKLPENELLPVKQALLEKGPLAILCQLQHHGTSMDQGFWDDQTAQKMLSSIMQSLLWALVPLTTLGTGMFLTRGARIGARTVLSALRGVPTGMRPIIVARTINLNLVLLAKVRMTLSKCAGHVESYMILAFPCSLELQATRNKKHEIADEFSRELFSLQLRMACV